MRKKKIEDVTSERDIDCALVRLTRNGKYALECPCMFSLDLSQRHSAGSFAPTPPEVGNALHWSRKSLAGREGGCHSGDFHYAKINRLTSGYFTQQFQIAIALGYESRLRCGEHFDSTAED